MFNDKYLRNRPFLLINTVYRPAKTAKTHQKNWHTKEGMLEAHEQHGIVDRINDTQMKNNNVIIDLIHGKCIKNVYSGVTDDEVVTHFLTKYEHKVKEAMDVWLSRLAQKQIAETNKPVTDATYTLKEVGQ